MFIVIGNFVVDIIGRPWERLPAPGELLVLETLETHLGGNGPNTAAALALLGEDVVCIGRVGRDLYGDFLLGELRGRRVRTEHVVVDRESPTGVTLVAVSASGERSFVHRSGANERLTQADVPDELLLPGSHLHLGAFFILPGVDAAGAATLFHRARSRGVTTSLDTCWDRERGGLSAIEPVLPLCDWFFPNEPEAAGIASTSRPEEAARFLLDRGCRNVVIKLGPAGCLYAGELGTARVPAFRTAVVDTTGAGDCFVAGFLSARRAGWDLDRSLRLANACGALNVGSVGAVREMAPRDEVEQWACGRATL